MNILVSRVDPNVQLSSFDVMIPCSRLKRKKYFFITDSSILAT